MSEKRRDNRNRILHEGEYQRADGRYRFRYVDIHGNEGNLYSWRLDNNDPIPKGKKMELSLREKEKQLEQDMFNGLVPGGGGLTVLELVNVIVNDSVRREAVTRKQEREFLRFIKEDAHFCKYYDAIFVLFNTGLRISDDDDKIRLNQRKPSKYKGLSRFGPEKNLQRINKFMKERPTFYKKLIQMKENFRFYLRCFYCITKVVILQFNSEKQDRISS